MLCRALTSAVLMVALAGCARTSGDGDFPSLAKRPIEAGTPAAASAQPVPAPVAADPGLVATLDRYRAQAQRGEAAFRARLPGAQAAIAAARGAAAASEPWVNAAMLLAALEFDRAPAQDALAELDVLLAERSISAENTGVESAELREIAALWRVVDAQVRAQTAAIDALKVQLTPA